MKSLHPYLIKAFYQWIIDSDGIPYIIVDTSRYKINVPDKYIEDNKIVFNISPSAVKELEVEREFVTFNAKFDGTPRLVSFPCELVTAVYDHNTGEGTTLHYFTGDEDEDEIPPPREFNSHDSSHLMLVKE